MTQSYVSLVGFLAGALTVVAFVPQVIKIARTKSTKDISLWMYIIFSMGVLLWLVYGILISAWPIVLANGIILCLSLTILAYKVGWL